MGSSQDLSLKVLLSAQNLAGGALSSFSGMLSNISGVAGIASVALVAIGAAVVAIGAKAVQMAAQYQQSLNMVQALTGSSTQQMAQYDQGLKALAIDAGVAPTALAQGLYQVISAGYSGAAAMNVLKLATQDSKIGMTDAKTTADALTNVLANFSFETKNATVVNGEMLETVTLGKSTFQQYASTITKAASTSAQFKISLETTSAAWATMTANGISAGKASTDYVQLVQAMDGKIQTIAKSLKKNGIAFNETKFNAESFGQKVQTLNGVLQEAAKKHVTITGVTLQAAQAITVISSHMKTYNSDLATLSNHQAMGQKTAQAWAITQSGFSQQMSRAGAAVQVLLINIGQQLLPVLTKIAQAVIPVILQFADWIQKSGLIQDIITVVTIDLGALAAGFQRIWPYIKQAIAALVQFGQEIISRLQPIISHLVQFIQQNWGAISGMVKGIFDVVVGVIKTAWAIITGIFKIALDILGGNWKQAWTDLQTMLSGVWDGIKQILQGAWTFITNAFRTWIAGIGTLAKGIFTGVIDAIKGGINFVIGLIDTVIGKINGIHINTPFGSIGFSIPTIPLLAGGGFVPPGHFAIAGEPGAGTELVAGGMYGATVFNNRQTQGMLGGGNRSTTHHSVVQNFNISVSVPPNASRQSMRQLARDLSEEMGKQMRANGTIALSSGFMSKA